MKKKINLDFQSLQLLESTVGKDSMIEFLNRYHVIITQDKESEVYLKELFNDQGKLKKSRRK